MKYRPDNSLEDLAAFLAVVHCGTFSAAARSMNLPPSSIARRIGAIEARLGVSLFQRTTRDVSLTEAGESYALSVERIMADLEAADMEASHFSSLPEGLLRIESRPGLSAWLLAPLLPRFLEAYPQIEVDLQLTSGTLENLSPGTDLGIRYGLGAPSSLVTRKLATTRQGTYASPAYLDRFGMPQTPDDLADHNCLAFSYGDRQVAWRYRNGDRETEVLASGNMRSNDVTAIEMATVNGLGVSVAHTWVMEKAVRDGRAVPILTDYEVTTMGQFDLHVSAIYAPAMKTVQKVRVFVDFMLRTLREDARHQAPDRTTPREGAAVPYRLHAAE